MASFAIGCVIPVYGDGTQTVFNVDLNSTPLFVSSTGLPLGPALTLSPRFDPAKPNPVGVIPVSTGITVALSGHTVILTFATAPAAGLSVNATFYLQYPS